MVRKTLVTIVVLLQASLAAAADIMYEAIDEKGGVTLQESPPTQDPAKDLKKYRHSTLIPTPQSRATPAKRNASGDQKSRSSKKEEPFTGTVEVYVTSWCPRSREALDYLKAKQIQHVAYDIEKDSSAHERYKELGGKGVPLIIVGSRKMSGFSAKLLERYLSGSE